MAKIFLIEDDRFLRGLMVKKLDDSGYQTEVATDGEEALFKIKEMDPKPDIILLDLILPGIDGFEVLKQLKEDNNFNKIPVIILSNLGQKFEIERGKSLGAVDYMVKAHFTPDEVVERVRLALNR